jgi:excinuclease UvrABC ATPase subunit
LRLLFSRFGKPHVGNRLMFSFNDPQGRCPECNGVGRKLGVDLDRFLDTSKSLKQGAILYPDYAVDSWGWNILMESGLFDADKPLKKYSDEEMERLLYSPPYKVKMKVGGKSVNLTFDGKRFKDEVLGYKLNGKSISDVLAMPAHEAIELFDNKEVRKKLQALSDVGLDYLTLGQPLGTLSGGECQRIKLASELHKKGSVYVMDEPTTGLHMSDIGRLLAIINRLVEGGNTVVVIEHNLDVIRNADWIIDMGPEGGSKGGKVMFEGTPKQLLTAKQSLTSAYLDGVARV